MKIGRALQRRGLAVLLAIAPLSVSAANSEQVHRGRPHDAMFAVKASRQGLIASGNQGKLWQSKDGITWQSLGQLGEQGALLDLSLSQEQLLAVGQQGAIYRREDNRWEAVDAPVKNRLFAVAQGAEGLAVAAGAFGAVLCSEDGGRSWRQADIDWPALIGQDYQPHIYNAGVDARGRLYIVGEFGLIARSSDAGKTWEALHIGEASLFGFALGRDGLAYAVGQRGEVLRSQDGGDSWTALSTNTKAILMDVAIRSDGVAVATGIRKAIVIRPHENRVRALAHEPFLESWYSDIAVLDDAFYAVGEQAMVVKISL